MLQRLRATPLAQRLRQALPGRPRTIEAGPGAGLRFDPGRADLSYIRGQNERPVQEAIARHARPGGVFWDVGANVGFFTVLAASLVGPEGLVYAFEPVPEHVAQIRRNARINGLGNVTVVEAAVAERSSRAALTLARHIGGAVLSEVGAPPDATTTITVDMVALDDLVREGRARAPQLVKIDVEGAEMQALRGMAETIAASRPVIICEVDAADSAALAPKRSACAGFLAGLGYQLADLEDSYKDIGWQVAHIVAVPIER